MIHQLLLVTVCLGETLSTTTKGRHFDIQSSSRASANSTKRFDLGQPRIGRAPMGCLAECIQSPACQAINAFTNGTCEIILSPVIGVEFSTESTTYMVCRPSEFFHINGANDCGNCYSLDLVLRTWTEAMAFCRSQGSNLVSIETARENEFLDGVIKMNHEHPLLKVDYKNPWFGFWTSGTDENVEGRWVWKSTDVPMSYTNWIGGQPDNQHGREHYVYIRASSGMWNDVPDDWRLFSVCERGRLC